MGRAEGMRLLTTVEERAALLMRAGIDYVVVARFDEQFRSQSFDNFVRESLVAKLGMRGLVVGYNHRLGRGNEGRYETLLPIADACGFILERVEQHLVIGSKVSSTVVRTQLEAGNIGAAAELLGHPYIIYGVAHAGVVEIGDEYKLLPADGLYRATLLYGDKKTAIDDECVSIERDVVLLGKPLDGKVEIVLTDRV
jgi:riboflavin kinase/FMN adenylyltransferase